MKVEVVVARYNEDIHWLNKLNCKKTIYNKGNDAIDGSIALPNIGRESHTYFHHIVENYENLSDWTFFIQANPFDHVKNMDWVIEGFPHTLEHSGKIKIDGQVYFFTNGHFKAPIFSNTDGSPFHFDKLDINGLLQMLEIRTLSQYEFTAGCLFCASKEAILRNDKEFYQKCLEISVTREKAPWEFERVMQYIFK